MWMSPVKNPEATRIDIPGYAMGGWTTMQGGSMGGERERESRGGMHFWACLSSIFVGARLELKLLADE